MESQNVSKNNYWRRAFFIQLIFFTILTGYLVYGIIDSGITITYMQDGYGDTINDFKTVMKLLPEVSHKLSKKDFLYLLRKNNKDALINDTGNSITIDFLIFHFNNKGKLIKVSSQMHGE